MGRKHQQRRTLLPFVEQIKEVHYKLLSAKTWSKFRKLARQPNVNNP
ncbi:MAG: hypothetical protein ICV84_19245 [Flavisolibacter sp.]|nr:hypothetical protein [Flavisolibacter sp.]